MRSKQGDGTNTEGSMEDFRQTEYEKEKIYQNALLLIKGNLFREAAQEFARIPDYRDARMKKTECEERFEAAKKDEIYADAVKAAANPNVKSQQKAIGLFRQIPGWRDAEERIRNAEARIEEIRAQERADREQAIELAREKRLAAARRRNRILLIAALVSVAVAVCIVGSIHHKRYTVPKERYLQAEKHLHDGETDEAYRMFRGMNYENSEQYLFEIAKEKLGNAEVGSTVLFGIYEQDGDASDGGEYIEWIVLEQQGSRRMLISKYALDCGMYQSLFEEQTVTWETCTLRAWLNGSFLSAAFSPAEQQMIQRTKVPADPNPYYHSNAGKDTFDRAYLLSISEVEKYFPTDSDRLCKPTKYAVIKAAYVSSKGSYCWWWLRTPGYDFGMDRAAGVGTNGSIITIGHSMYNEGYSIRPVIWIDLDTEWVADKFNR